MKETNRAPVTGESAGASPVVPATFLSRRRQAAKAPGLHPGIPGVRVPPSRPFSFWCGRQARHRAVNSTHEGALPSTKATFFRDIAQQQSAPFGTVRSRVQPLLSRPFLVPGSSNSRTRGFEPQNRGASPRPGASFRRKRGVQTRRTAGLLNRTRGHARRGAVPLSSAILLGV